MWGGEGEGRASDTIAGLLHTIEGKDIELDELRASLSELRQHVTTLQSDLDAERRVPRDVAELRHALSEEARMHDLALARLEEVRAEVDGAQRDAEGAQSLLAAARQESEQRKQESEELKARLKSAQDLLSDRESALLDWQSHAQALSDKAQEHEDALRALDEQAKAQVADLHHELDELREHNTALQAAEQRLREELEAERDAVQEAKRREDEGNGAHRDVAQRLREAESEARKHRKAVDQLTRQLERAHKDKADAQQRVEQLESETRAQHSALEEWRGERGRLEGAVSELQARVREVEQEKAELGQRVAMQYDEAVARDIAQLRDRIGQLEQSDQALRDKVERRNKQVQELTHHARQLQGQLQAKAHDLSRMSVEIDGLRREIEESDDSNRRHNKALETLRARLASTEAALEQAREGREQALNARDQALHDLAIKTGNGRAGASRVVGGSCSECEVVRRRVRELEARQAQLVLADIASTQRRWEVGSTGSGGSRSSRSSSGSASQRAHRAADLVQREPAHAVEGACAAVVNATQARSLSDAVDRVASLMRIAAYLPHIEGMLHHVVSSLRSAVGREAASAPSIDELPELFREWQSRTDEVADLKRLRDSVLEAVAKATHTHIASFSSLPALTDTACKLIAHSHQGNAPQGDSQALGNPQALELFCRLFDVAAVSRVPAAMYALQLRHAELTACFASLRRVLRLSSVAECSEVVDGVRSLRGRVHAVERDPLPFLSKALR